MALTVATSPSVLLHPGAKNSVPRFRPGVNLERGHVSEGPPLRDQVEARAFSTEPQSWGGAQGKRRIWPILSFEGSAMPFSRINTRVVVPKRAAMALSVSPLFTL